MEVLDDIVAAAAGEEVTQLEDAIQAYEKEALQQLLQNWEK